MVVVRNDVVMSSVDAAKRFEDVKTVRDIINRYGAVDPGVRIFFFFSVRHDGQ